MKRKFRFCKIEYPKNFYYKNIKVYYIIQKHCWFGWKNLILILDSNWGSHYGWSYSKPGRCGDDDKFESEESCMLFLKTHYGKLKSKVTCV